MELSEARSHGCCRCALLLEFLSVLPDLLHRLCGAYCQLLNCLVQMFAADAESTERRESVVVVCSACDSYQNDHGVDNGGWGCLRIARQRLS